MDLDKVLEELGWRQVDLCRRLNLRPETVSRWKNRPPDWVVAYLDAMLTLKRIAVAAGRAVR